RMKTHRLFHAYGNASATISRLLASLERIFEQLAIEFYDAASSFAPKQLENGKVPSDRACSAKEAGRGPQRGLITTQSDEGSAGALSDRRMAELYLNGSRPLGTRT